MVLSDKTTKVLRKAGWMINRKVDISDYQKVLCEEGYIPNEESIRFLNEFGGLKIEFPSNKVFGKKEDAVFDPTLAVSKVYKENVDSYGERIGEMVVVIGEAFKGYMVLVMSEKGRVYAGFDNFLIFVG